MAAAVLKLVHSSSVFKLLTFNIELNIIDFLDYQLTNTTFE